MNILGGRQIVSGSKACWEMTAEIVVLLFSWSGYYDAAK